MRLAMGKWLKHSGIEARGSASARAAIDGRLPPNDGRLCGCVGRWVVEEEDCCS
jgi:hypothetical protein